MFDQPDRGLQPQLANLSLQLAAIVTATMSGRITSQVFLFLKVHTAYLQK